MIERSYRLAMAALLLTSPYVAVAQSQSQTSAKPSALYVFGDSLSDRGNLAELLGAFPNPPSYHDSFTNGEVAVQILAQRAGLNADPSLWVTGFTDPRNLFGGVAFTPGTNYAVAGATAQYQAAGGPAGINLPQQIGAYGALTRDKADPNALYTVFIGGNDVRNAAKVTTTVGGVTTTVAGAGAPAIMAGVSSELSAIQSLLGYGAKNLLVINVPNVGVIPEFTQDNPTFASSATSLSQLYDSELSNALTGISLNGASIKQFDLYTYQQNLLSNAAGYGFTDSTDRCYTATPFAAAATLACGPNGANVNQYVYWDAIHPTARVDELVGGALGDFVGLSAVPEPSTWAMMIIGLGVVGAGFRNRRSRHVVRITYAS